MKACRAFLYGIPVDLYCAIRISYARPARRSSAFRPLRAGSRALLLHRLRLIGNFCSPITVLSLHPVDSVENEASGE